MNLTRTALTYDGSEHDLSEMIMMDHTSSLEIPSTVVEETASQVAKLVCLNESDLIELFENARTSSPALSTNRGQFTSFTRSWRKFRIEKVPCVATFSVC